MIPGTASAPRRGHDDVDTIAMATYNKFFRRRKVACKKRGHIDCRATPKQSWRESNVLFSNVSPAQSSTVKAECTYYHYTYILTYLHTYILPSHVHSPCIMQCNATLSCLIRLGEISALGILIITNLSLFSSPE